MLKKLICWLKGHKWGFYALVDYDGKCEYTKCNRCGEYEGNGATIVEEWLAHDNIDHYLIVGD